MDSHTNLSSRPKYRQFLLKTRLVLKRPTDGAEYMEKKVGSYNKTQTSPYDQRTGSAS
jgi:hypothetical protein